ncbi:hypothetical protein Pmani_005465 [Petrolisthes manimaculis]|uniref:Uncharacterized protein n=1 Tax=Petrolisthes manimaculis TaxID=1843537 RepID=A0AAE1UM50_9EUCA|nr:hypothetical protein Pmani_005465 [Petrolisthes manimaculis]
MFNSLRSPCSSPCPSPVREFAATIKRVSSPRRQKYKTFIGSQEPIISKSRMTMTGGFTDFRPCAYLDEDLEEFNDASSSSLSSSRSDSCDSGDVIIPSQATKPTCRFVKVPRKAFTSVIGHLSPSLSKKVTRAVQTENIPEDPKPPMWPNVMNTYGRGVSSSPVQAILMPPEPSLTAMKAQAILDERRDIRIALQMLAYKSMLQQQIEANHSKLCEREEERDEHSSSDEDVEDQSKKKYMYPTPEKERKYGAPLTINAPSPDTFPINPAININLTNGHLETPETSGDEGFQDESLFDAFDLDSVPTLTPEELTSAKVAEVRNVHLVCDFIVLETGPPTDSVYV